MEISAAREERLGWIGLLKAEGNKYLIFSWIFKVHITPNKKKNDEFYPLLVLKWGMICVNQMKPAVSMHG